MEYKSLWYTTTNSKGYREYKRLNYQCSKCLDRELCTESRDCQKVVMRHIWADYLDQAEDIRHSRIGKESYKLHLQTIERVFADAKEKYEMIYIPYRVIKRVSM